jgi:HEAT repeat protein
MAARRMAIENYADESFIKEFDDTSVDSGTRKSPEEVEQMIEKYGAVRLARALGKFRGSPNAMRSLGIIMKRGEEASKIALENLAQALVHANAEVREAAENQLKQLKDAELITHLVGMMEDTRLNPRILEVLRQIDHPEARQIVESIDS